MILQGVARPHKCKFLYYQPLIFEKQKTLSVLWNKHIINSLNSQYNEISSVFIDKTDFKIQYVMQKQKEQEPFWKININKLIWLEFLPIHKS